MTALNFNGALLTLPGSEEQLWHTDGEHLFSSEDDFHCWGPDGKNVAFFDKSGGTMCKTFSRQSILPAHCINLFVPLVDVREENGATQFCMGSHFHTKFFPDDIVWQDSTWKDKIGFDGDIVTIKVFNIFNIHLSK